MHMPLTLLTQLKRSLSKAILLRHRVLLVLAGDANMHLSAVCNAFLQFEHNNTRNNALVNNADSNTERCALRLSATRSNTDPSDKINALLGTEHELVVFDATQHFDERYFAAATGTVTAGGLLILQTPAIEHWSAQAAVNSTRDYAHGAADVPLSDQTAKVFGQTSAGASHFINRIVSCINRYDQFGALQNNTGPNQVQTSCPAFLIGPALDGTEALQHSYETWLQEQNQLLRQLMDALCAQEKSVVVVQADRGRGKSALIGRALHQLRTNVSYPITNITVTASQRSSCSVLLKHAGEPANALTAEHEHVTATDASDAFVTFSPLDTALATHHSLLVVEEAGSLPIAVLLRLLHQSKHIVFATTVQGYEGAGRGFAIRFARALDTYQPGWLKLSPTQPIRWGPHDQLEAFTDDALLQNAVLPDVPRSAYIDASNTVVSGVSKSTLANDQRLLEQVYSLLVQAHYQTTPRDLRHLLDAPYLHLFVQRANEMLTGAALVAVEGNIAAELHEPILLKQRRLPDQILPQMLAQCSNIDAVLGNSFARVVRIAVHPALQGQGFGTRLLEQTSQLLIPVSSSIGASFGADTRTLGFWQKSGMQPIHLGHRINPRSGLRSVCVMRSNDSNVNGAIQSAHALLCKNLDAIRVYKPETDTLVQTILNSAAVKDPPIGNGVHTPNSNLSQHRSNNNQLLHQYSLKQRNFMDSVAAINEFAKATTNTAVHELLTALLGQSAPLQPKKQRELEQKLRELISINLGSDFED